MPTSLKKLLSLLGKHSYFVYLVHPLFISYLTYALVESGLIMTAPVAVCFYASVLALSLLSAALMRWLGEKFPLVNQLTIGVYRRREK